MRSAVCIVRPLREQTYRATNPRERWHALWLLAQRCTTGAWRRWSIAATISPKVSDEPLVQLAVDERRRAPASDV